MYIYTRLPNFPRAIAIRVRAWALENENSMV